jgi:hypothetical protein
MTKTTTRIVAVSGTTVGKSTLSSWLADQIAMTWSADIDDLDIPRSEAQWRRTPAPGGWPPRGYFICDRAPDSHWQPFVYTSPPCEGAGKCRCRHCAWRKRSDFSIIKSLAKGMDERKPLIRLGSWR